MRTSVILVDGMMSICDGRGVEKRLRRHSGIVRVEANFLNGTATVEFEEARISLLEIQRLVSECGYLCGGECLPAHVRRTEDPHGNTRARRLATEADRR